MTSIHWVPVELLGLFTVVAVGGRVGFHVARYGTTGLAFFKGSFRDHLADLVIGTYALALGAEAILAATHPEWLGQWGAFPNSPLFSGLGAAVVITALVLTVLAQLQMGASWRIGIDPAARPGLVTSGAFRFSRNPIYACMLLALAGYLLVLPNTFTLVLALLAWGGIQAQVLREESYLRRTYGSQFDEYTARVGRFLPRWGRAANGAPGALHRWRGLSL